jgi:hypothetical protein
MKQTAVEFLFKELSDTPKDRFAWYYIFEKAKEMEEGQIALAYSKGTLDGVNKDFTNGYTYYQKTYGKDA